MTTNDTKNTVASVTYSSVCRKKSNSFRVNTDTDTDSWSSPSSPVKHLNNPASPGTASAFRPMSRQPPIPNSEDVPVSSPTSQLAAPGNSRQVIVLSLNKHAAFLNWVALSSHHLDVSRTVSCMRPHCTPLMQVRLVLMASMKSTSYALICRADKLGA